MPLREQLRPYLRGGRGQVGWQANDMFAEREARSAVLTPTAITPSAAHQVGTTRLVDGRYAFAAIDPLARPTEVVGVLFRYSVAPSAPYWECWSALYAADGLVSTRFQLLRDSVVDAAPHDSTSVPGSPFELFVRLPNSVTLPERTPLLITSEVADDMRGGSNNTVTMWEFGSMIPRYMPPFSVDRLSTLGFPEFVDWSAMLSVSENAARMPQAHYITGELARRLGVI